MCSIVHWFNVHLFPSLECRASVIGTKRPSEGEGTISEDDEDVDDDDNHSGDENKHNNPHHK